MTWQASTPWQAFTPQDDLAGFYDTFPDLLTTHMLMPSGRRLCGATAGPFAIDEPSFLAAPPGWGGPCQGCLDVLATGRLEEETAQATHFCLFGVDVLCGAKGSGWSGPGEHTPASPWTSDLSWFLSLDNPVKRCPDCLRLLAGLVAFAIEEVVG
jgi:hypothetical protein